MTAVLCHADTTAGNKVSLQVLGETLQNAKKERKNGRGRRKYPVRIELEEVQ